MMELIKLLRRCTPPTWGSLKDKLVYPLNTEHSVACVPTQWVWLNKVILGFSSEYCVYLLRNTETSLNVLVQYNHNT